MALIERPATEPHGPIQPEEATKALHTGVWGDEAALKLVVADAIRAENYEATKAWVMQWPMAVALYQSPFAARYWDGSQIERANVPFFTVAKAVNSLTPQMVKGIFYDDPPFSLQPRAGTKAQAARAVGAVLAYQLEDINFRESLRLGINNALLFGTTIWKWGWESYTRERTVYKRAKQPLEIKSPLGDSITLEPTEDEVEAQTYEEEVERPFFEHIVNLRHVLVDPGLNVPDIRKAKYVIHRMYMTFDQLEQLRDLPDVTLPSKEMLLSYLMPPKEPVEAAASETATANPLWDARAEPRYNETTADPFAQPLEVLERWDGDRFIMVLQRKLVIANGKNKYGTIPFFSLGWWDVPEAFWSLGLAKTIGAEQRLQQGVMNAWLDTIALNLNPVFLRVRGKNVPTQTIRLSPGKLLEIDKQGDMAPLNRTASVPEAMQALVLSSQRAEQISGASESLTQGVAGSSGHSNMARSGTGAGILASGAAAPIEDFVEKLANQVIVPFLYAAHELNCALLPMSVWKRILSEELQHEYLKEGNDVMELLNARVRFAVLAAAKMQARRTMAQSLPILIQYLQQPALIEALGMEGKKVNVTEMVRMFFEVSDWRNYADVIVEQTPEDKKRWQTAQTGGAQQQLQGKMALQKQQADLKSNLIDQENVARAGREVLRQAIEQSATPETVTGEPGGRGFGNNE